MPSNSDPTLDQRSKQAGNEIYDAVYHALKTDRGVHLETSLAAVGYAAGCAVLKSTGVNLAALPPGAHVFVEQVNELGPQVIEHLLDLVSRGQQSGTDNLYTPPAPSVPPDHSPLRSCEDLLQLLWSKVEAILNKHSIPADRIPYVCIAPASRLIIEGQTQLAPSIAKAIVVEALVKGSKTVPPKTPIIITRAINSRDDFLRMLSQTTAEIDGFAAREPAYPVWDQLRQQLHAIEQWTANHAQPTPEQQQRISIGLIAARELEPAVNEQMDDLITRLHLLNHYWRNWPVTPSPARHTELPGSRKLARMFLLAIPVCLAIAAIAFFALRIKSPYGTPISPSVRTPKYIATLISTLEPYTVSLNRNPANDRYRVGLFLYPLDGSSSGRLVPIASEFRASELRFGARILGNDGNNLWFFVKGIGALDLRTEKLITASDLRRLNPSLTNLPGVDNSHDPLLSPEVRRYKAPPTDLWADDSRRYAFAQRLRVTAPDFRQTFEVDPATLKAAPAQFAGNPPPEDRPEHFLTAGGLLSPAKWIGVHSLSEAARDFKPGSGQSPYHAAEKSKELRRIYTGRVEQGPAGTRFNLRIASLEQLPGTGDYLNAALLCGAREGAPMGLTHPDGFLITYTSKPGLEGTLVLARFEKTGKSVWAVDTGIGTLQQILPDSHSVAFIGLRPQVEGKVREPILAIVDTKSGRLATSTLWK